MNPPFLLLLCFLARLVAGQVPSMGRCPTKLSAVVDLNVEQVYIFDKKRNNYIYRHKEITAHSHPYIGSSWAAGMKRRNTQYFWKLVASARPPRLTCWTSTRCA